MSFQSTVQQFYGTDLVSSALGAGRYISVANSLIGGNLSAILLKRKLISKAKATGYGSDGVSNALPNFANLAGIPISTRLQETYEFASEVSTFALESGAKVTDHVILNPIRIECSFAVTNMDIFADPSHALVCFHDLWRSRQLTDLVTKHQVLRNMVLASFSVLNDATSWGSLEFRATFQQVSFYNFTKVFQVSSEQLKNEAKGATTPTQQTSGITAVQAYTDGATALKQAGK